MKQQPVTGELRFTERSATNVRRAAKGGTEDGNCAVPAAGAASERLDHRGSERERGNIDSQTARGAHVGAPAYNNIIYKHPPLSI